MLISLSINIKKVDKQLTHAMNVKDRYVNDTLVDKLTNVISDFDCILIYIRLYTN